MEPMPCCWNQKKCPPLIDSWLPIFSTGDKFCPLLLFRKEKKRYRKDNTKEKRGGLEVGLGSQGDELLWVQPGALLFEVVLIMNFEKHSREDRAFSSRAWPHVRQRILACCWEAAFGGATRQYPPPSWCGHFVLGCMTSLYGVTGPGALCFVSYELLCSRNAELH